MTLSAPIYQLKRTAKRLAREAGLSLHEALDRIAREEGFQSWSLLINRHPGNRTALKILSDLTPGDIFLLAARPGHGKTLTALQLIIETIRNGGLGVFYTLEYTERDVSERLKVLGTDRHSLGDAFTCDTSDAISADYIISQLSGAVPGTLVVIDYLQLLDQDRDKPDLSVQVAALKAFACDAGLILVVLSQIDRTYDSSTKALPDPADVRLPNPLDLKLFTKACFLNDGKVKMAAIA